MAFPVMEKDLFDQIVPNEFSFAKKRFDGRGFRLRKFRESTEFLAHFEKMRTVRFYDLACHSTFTGTLDTDEKNVLLHEKLA